MTRHSSILIAVALALTACNPLPHEASTVPAAERDLSPVAVDTITVERRTAMLHQEVVGTVVPKLRARIASKLAGRVAAIDVDLGSRVEQGQRLARIDAEEIRARLAQAVAQRDQAEKDLARYQELLRKQAVAQREFDAIATQAEVAREAVAEAEAMLAYTIIEAPFAGVITAKQADVGDLAMPGQALLMLADPQQLRLEANVPEQVVEHIAVGDCQELLLDDVLVQACVAEIAPTADPLSRTVLVKLDLPPHEQLGIGRFARVRMPVGQRELIRVPAAALVRRGQLDMAFAVEDGTARMRLIRRGPQEGDQVTILSGLQDGDVIVANPPPMLADGQALK